MKTGAWFGAAVEVIGGPPDGEIIVVDERLTYGYSHVEYGWRRQHRYRYDPQRMVFEYVEQKRRKPSRQPPHEETPRPA